MTPSENVAANIERLRKWRGYTQAELSEKLGLHQTAIAKIEAGTRKVTLDEFAVLCDIFDVSPELMLTNGALWRFKEPLIP